LVTYEVYIMKIHIGSHIKSVAVEKKVRSTELAKMINTSKQNVYGIYKRASIDVVMLLEISKALNYNFFSHYLQGENSLFDDQQMTETLLLRKQIAHLKMEVKRLTELNALLQKVNVLLEDAEHYQVKKKS
jgi:DNA-binding Xre family transcriptional regulator